LLEDRRGFTKEDVRYLMSGSYLPTKIPNVKTYTDKGDREKGTFQQRLKEINRQLETNFKLSDFINEKELKSIYKKWKSLKLGINIDDQDEALKVPLKFKNIERRGSLQRQRMLKKLQNNRFIGQNFIGEQPTPENNVRPFNANPDNQASLIKPNVPSDTAPVSAETVKMASVNNNVNPQTNLTRIEDALLSQTEKAIKLGQRKTTV
jgi:hypothetical protein